jgi:hypothetical protein
MAVSQTFYKMPTKVSLLKLMAEINRSYCYGRFVNVVSRLDAACSFESIARV